MVMNATVGVHLVFFEAGRLESSIPPSAETALAKKWQYIVQPDVLSILTGNVMTVSTSIFSSKSLYVAKNGSI